MTETGSPHNGFSGPLISSVLIISSTAFCWVHSRFALLIVGLGCFLPVAMFPTVLALIINRLAGRGSHDRDQDLVED